MTKQGLCSRTNLFRKATAYGVPYLFRGSAQLAGAAATEDTVHQLFEKHFVVRLRLMPRVDAQIPRKQCTNRYNGQLDDGPAPSLVVGPRAVAFWKSAALVILDLSVVEGVRSNFVL